MTTVNEGQHTGEFIVSEANGSLSRESILLASGQVYQAGHVLGRVSTSTAVGAAAAGNTGNGAISAVTASGAAKPGVYNLVCIEPAANGGTFEIEGPDGVIVDRAAVGAAYAGVIGFTIADGATDFVAGDRFTVTVSATLTKYKEWNPTHTDGTQTAYAVLYATVDATGADQHGVGIVRTAEINGAELIWFTGATDNQKAAGLAQLKTQGIVAR